MTEKQLIEKIEVALSSEPEVRAVVERLMEHSPEFYLFGGAVRDLALGLDKSQIKDFDVLVTTQDLSWLPQAVTGLGTLDAGVFLSRNLWTHSGVRFDICAIALFANGLHPCRDIEDLLSTTDSSINAVGYDVRNRRIIDPVGGLKDITQRRMRLLRPDRPEKPLLDFMTIPYPAILWFRTQSQALKYGFTLDAETMQWLREKRHYLAHQAAFEKLFWPPRLMDLATG